MGSSRLCDLVPGLVLSLTMGRDIIYVQAWHKYEFDSHKGLDVFGSTMAQSKLTDFILVEALLYGTFLQSKLLTPGRPSSIWFEIV